MDLDGIGIWSFELGYGDRDESAEAAAELGKYIDETKGTTDDFGV